MVRFTATLFLLAFVIGNADADDPLPGTTLLTEIQPLDEVMVAGIDRFAVRQLAKARKTRPHPDAQSAERFRRLIGVVDKRVADMPIEFIATADQPSRIAVNENYTIDRVRWPVLPGVTAEGLWLRPVGDAIARVVAIPDADWTPEMIAGLEPSPTRFAADLAAIGCEVLVPTLISRDYKFSGNPAIGRRTNLSHREFVYRQAFEVGRHVIGYEVQKVLAAVDQFDAKNKTETKLPIAVVGVSEGGLLALYSGAIDERIDATVVSGYFGDQIDIWRKPIYRNVWKLLTEFGDAELANMIGPRKLFIEIAPKIPTVTEAPKVNRVVAAPGTIDSPQTFVVKQEIKRARKIWTANTSSKKSEWLQAMSGVSGSMPLPILASRVFVSQISGKSVADLRSKDFNAEAQRYFKLLAQRRLRIKELTTQLERVDLSENQREMLVLEMRKLMEMQLNDVSRMPTVAFADGIEIDPQARQKRQVAELVAFTQKLLHDSHRIRERRFASLDRTSVAAWEKSSEPVRDSVYEDLIGRLPDPTITPNPRTRKVIDEADYTGYEVVLDVYPDVIASGVLLLPKGMAETEKRPVVVCQHGLEGTPMHTIGGPESEKFRAYKAFSVELVKRGYIVYAPQNPYRGKDRFRTLQRKSNPLGRSLFSYIIPQHLVTLRWLASLPNVDRDRIGFYGLSYGGKTAMRVPPFLVPTKDEPGYCLSICSGDFNEWILKNASVDAPFSYLWTGEYEIYEWNMAHVANYAELAMLMTPRPFMVERGHDDGVGIDEWVAWEYAKVRRHYKKLGISDRTEVEYFDGPHTINGQGTYRFLNKHLNWQN